MNDARVRGLSMNENPDVLHATAPFCGMTTNWTGSEAVAAPDTAIVPECSPGDAFDAKMRNDTSRKVDTPTVVSSFSGENSIPSACGSITKLRISGALLRIVTVRLRPVR